MGGGGIAGAAFSTVMARAGYDVLMIEITPEHRDVVRGEWIAPWGVAKGKRPRLCDPYRSHGAHQVTRHKSRQSSYLKIDGECHCGAIADFISRAARPRREVTWVTPRAHEFP